MFLAFHYPFFGSTTVDAHQVVCPACKANDWKGKDISTCNPGDTFECARCGKLVYVNWGIDQPDHLSNWISSEHCPHELCRLKYQELCIANGWGETILMRTHYGFFMANKRFWYDRELQEPDKLICVAASDIRQARATRDER